MTEEPTANPVGRPTKYRPDYHPAWAEKLAKLGATDEDIASSFDISIATLYNWRNDYQEFLEATRRGKLLADAEVASKLFHRATGYQHEETDVKVLNGEVVLTPVVKNYPPDTNAAMFWLRNRRPDLWRDKPPEATDNEESKPVKVVVEVKDARKPNADA